MTDWTLYRELYQAIAAAGQTARLDRLQRIAPDRDQARTKLIVMFVHATLNAPWPASDRELVEAFRAFVEAFRAWLIARLDELSDELDLSTMWDQDLIELYGVALEEKLALVAHRRAMPTATPPELVEAADSEIDEQNAWVTAIETELRKRGMLR